jgi:hypothetical protein
MSFCSEPDSDQDPTLKIVSNSAKTFSNRFNINFTFVSPSCKRVGLHISAHFHLLFRL